MKGLTGENNCLPK